MKSLITTSPITGATCITSTDIYATYNVTPVSVQIWAPLVELVYQSSDLSLNATVMVTTAPSSLGSSVATPPYTDSDGGGSALSSGAKIGLGIGVAVAALGIAFDLIWFWRWRRKELSALPVRAAEPDAPSEHPGTYKGGHQSHEMPVIERPSELRGET